MMSQRNEQIAAFLARHGFRAAQAVPLAPDASFRRYLRLLEGPRPAILMDAPPPEDVRPFVRMACHLRAIGLSAPYIIAAEPEYGLVLEEDLGDGLLPTLLSPATAGAMFDTAVDVLIAMQRTAPLPDLPCWDAAVMARTALGTLLDWWWPATFSEPAPDAARCEIGAALEAMLAPVAQGPGEFVHRDFFIGNLIWLPDRKGLRRLGLLDFQNAATGHPAYDLVSLIQDSRRDIPPEIGARVVERYLAARPELDTAAFRAAMAACAAQRHLRIAGQWVRLARRDGRPHYLAYGPHTWRSLDVALAEPVAAPLGAVLDRWIPRSVRGNPPGLAA
jgi:aminoglycoside/choline kinase family phosphotransferase